MVSINSEAIFDFLIGWFQLIASFVKVLISPLAQIGTALMDWVSSIQDYFPIYDLGFVDVIRGIINVFEYIGELILRGLDFISPVDFNSVFYELSTLELLAFACPALIVAVWFARLIWSHIVG